MDTNTNDDVKSLVAQRMAELPKVVQNAITSADTQKLLRDLANTQKLHIDQWQKLENEVMLALLGFQPVESLAKNFEAHVGVSAEVANALAESANNLVFIPIRQELERQLEHPEARAKEVSGIEAARDMALQSSATGSSADATAQSQPPAIRPATPPQPSPEGKVVRSSDSSAYRPGEPSSVRAAVADDPYREPPV